MEDHKESNKNLNEVSNEKSDYAISENKNILSHLIKIKDKVTIFDKLFRIQARDYLLSYKLNYEKNNPRYMSIDEMYDYVEYFYRDGIFKKDNLKSDLVVFKSYKDELEIELRRNEFFVSCLNGAITAVTIILSLLAPNELEEKNPYLSFIVLIAFGFMYIILLNYMFWSYPNSKPNRIKTLADNINYLNFKKEEIYNVDKKIAKSEENLNRIRDIQKFETRKKKKMPEGKVI